MPTRHWDTRAVHPNEPERRQGHDGELRMHGPALHSPRVSLESEESRELSLLERENYRLLMQLTLHRLERGSHQET